MGNTQKHFKSMVTVAMATMMNGGMFRGKNYNTSNPLFGPMFGNKSYSGSPRIMFTLPPITEPVERSPEVKARKRTMRRKRRARLETRGF